MAHLEHINMTVPNAHRTAAWMKEVFDWTVRWEGSAMNGQGYTVHVGDQDGYIALYSPKSTQTPVQSSYAQSGGLNHLAVTVDDLAAAQTAVRKAGFEPHSHANYEPGRRFYFHDQDGIEFEVVSYA